MRIFIGYVCLILGAPLFIACLINGQPEPDMYFMTGIVTALGVACVYPRRWMI